MWKYSVPSAEAIRSWVGFQIGSGAIRRIKIRERPLDVVLKQLARLPILVEYGHGERR